MTTRRWWWAAAVAAVLAGGAPGAPYVVLRTGQRLEGATIRARSDGTVVLIRPDGQQLTLTRDQYTEAGTDKPAEFDRAAAAVQAGRYDEAIPILQKIMTDLRFLRWDREAGLLLVRAYRAKNDGAAMLKVYDTLIKDYPALANDPEVGWAYREALIAARQFAEVEKQLPALIKSENRLDAGRALLMRGDIRQAQGNIELAIRDYLRVVLFFERETALMPAALLRTAQALEKNRDGRAKEFYRRLLQEYPESPEAAAAKGKA
ncbi:MAG: tetratricopeptide repeat protein [Kiritimatiellae bacterium]|nr:tetratricopeptide repeat protein [Kiritimatiellia bacterium]